MPEATPLPPISPSTGVVGRGVDGSPEGVASALAGSYDGPLMGPELVALQDRYKEAAPPPTKQVVYVGLVGDAGVGKSSIITRIVEDFFVYWYDATSQVEMARTRVDVDMREVEVLLHDTPGGIEYRHKVRELMNPQHLDPEGQPQSPPPNAKKRAAFDMYLVVFDVTDRRTFEGLTAWMNLLKDDSPSSLVVLVGNKVEPGQTREVSTEEGKAYGSGCGVPYVELSAKSKDGKEKVQEVWSACLKACYARGNKSGREMAHYVGMIDGSQVEPPRPTAMLKDPSNSAISDDELCHLFKKYDVDGNGWISRHEMKRIIRDHGNPGLEETQTERVLEGMLAPHCRLGPERISLPEFSILMLRLAAH